MLLREPGRSAWEENVAIDVKDGRIAHIDAKVQSSARHLLIPALADAHDHGRGLRCTAYGAIDQPLETWLPLLYEAPRTSGYLNTAISLCRLAHAGVAAVVSCHAVQDADNLHSELVEAARAANDVGMRLALVIPLRDRNPLVYGSVEKLLACLNPRDRSAVLERWAKPALAPKEQVDRVHEVAECCDSPLVNVQLGPLAPQWVSDELFECIAEDSARNGRRIHMHLLETRYQREWADAQYPQGLLRHLDALGILCERLTVAHGVWLRPDEMDLLAERRVIVSINTSSNLRLRSGLAPVREMLRRGVRLAVGIDGFSVDDDDDAGRELRLLRWLHDGPGFAHGIDLATLWRAATGVGAEAVTGRADAGALQPGMAADMIAVDWEALSYDAVESLADRTELLMARFGRRYVRDLWVAGRRVVENGAVVGIDEATTEAELLARARADASRIDHARPLALRLSSAIERFYSEGYHCARLEAPDSVQLSPQEN